MSRYAETQPTAPQSTLEGDTSWTSLNMKDDRASLQPGEYSLLVNGRLSTSEGRNRIVAKRGGTIKPLFANPVPTIFSGIKGSGVYITPNETESLLVADSSNVVFQIVDNNFPRSIPIPDGENLDGPCEFVQSNDKVLLLRGQFRNNLIWDGISTTGFVLAVKSDPANTATASIPRIETAEPFEDRLLYPIPGQPNTFGMSDDLDYTTTSSVQQFTIPSGSGGSMVRLFEWAQGTLIVGYHGSIRSYSGFAVPAVDDEGIVTYPNGQIQKINDTIGFAARHAVIDVGGDVHFLSEPGGIYAISQVIQDKNQTLPVPISNPIEPLIHRINWRYASNARAISHDNHIYWFFPVDDSRRNNCCAVYDSTTGQWEAYDSWAGTLINFNEVHITKYLGQRQLFGVDHTSNTIYVLYIGKEDQLSNGVHEIAMKFETRGYAALGWNATTKRDFKFVEIAVETWNPIINITLIGKGFNDERLLTPIPITKNRLTYYTFGTLDYNPTNINNDFDAPQREDYSILVPEEPGMTLWDDSDGIDPEKKQESMIRMSLKKRDRFVIFRIEVPQGDCDIKGLKLESSGITKNLRIAA